MQGGQNKQSVPEILGFNSTVAFQLVRTTPYPVFQSRKYHFDVMYGFKSLSILSMMLVAASAKPNQKTTVCMSFEAQKIILTLFT